MDNDTIEKKEKVCEYCGKKFFPRRSNQKYCDKKCQHKSNYEKSKNIIYEYECPNCKKIYQSKIRQKESFCSLPCKKEYEYKKRLLELTEDLDDNLGRNKTNVGKGVIWDIVNLKVERIISKATEGNVAFNRTINYWNLADIPKSTREFVLQRDEHRCQICERKDKLEIHHMIKRINGGDHNPLNLITLCSSCHRYVETMDVELATKGCYKNALKYFSLEEEEPHITFDEIHKELLSIYKNSKKNEKEEALYKIGRLIDKIENELYGYY